MTNKEKLARIKEILGSEYDGVAVFAGKGQKTMNPSIPRGERTTALVDMDSGALAAAIVNYLQNDPIAVSFLKITFNKLDSDPLTDMLLNTFLGGNEE